MSNFDDRVVQVMERAKDSGLRLEFDSGLLLVKQTKSGDPEKQAESIAELGKCLSEIRRFAEARAIGARAKEFVGQKIWSEAGAGTLVAASEDGTLTVSVDEAQISETPRKRRFGIF